jgi:hypothetical protein
MKKYPTAGGKIFNSFQFAPMFKKSNESHLVSFEKMGVIDDIIEDLEEKNRKHLKAFEDILPVILKKAKKSANINKFQIVDYKKWQDAYYSSNEEVMKEINKTLSKNISDTKLGNCQRVTGYPTLEFFNYYNMTERSNSSERPLIREMVNVFTASHIAKYKEEFFVHMDSIVERLHNNDIPKKMEEIIIEEKGNKQKRKRNFS